MWPPTDVWGQGAQRFADLVKERTGGKYEIRVYPSGQLGNEREMEEGLQVGSLDFTFGGSDVLSSFEPKMACSRCRSCSATTIIRTPCWTVRSA